MSRAQENVDSVNESIEITQESKQDNWMSSYLKGDIEFMGSNGAFKRTEQGKATKKDKQVQTISKAKNGSEVNFIPAGMEDIEADFLSWEG
tara:strand:+ start:96 stop:368 length:273 start_codon:yes stop_codon:yes gene_type:complete